MARRDGAARGPHDVVPSLLRGRGVRPVAKQFCDETVGPGSAAAAGTHGEPSTARLGELLVEQKLITPGQLEESLRRQREAPRWTPLGHVLVSQGLLTRKQLDLVLDRYKKRSRLGEILLAARCLTPEQLQLALDHHLRSGQQLGRTLLKLGYVTEETLRLALCTQLHIHYFDLDTIILDRSLRGLVNKKYAARHLVVPLARVGNKLVVALDDPTKTGLIEDLQASVGLTIEVVTSTTSSIRRAFARLYGETITLDADQADRVILSDPNARALYERLVSAAPRTPGVGDSRARRPESGDEILRQLLHAAIVHRASDVHLESLDHRLQVRFRIDGVLQAPDLGPLEEALHANRAEIVSRVKIVSRLDISEKRRPQDGRFRVVLEKDGQAVNVDFRVSIIPGYHGENVVLRMLDPRAAPRSIETLGLAPAITARFGGLLRATAGMILVTGPTGSGKSTTLFGVLRTLYRPGIKILTAENPIEYVDDRFSQHEVNDRLGNTFARYLRAFLRHDPEVIMVGEIRDAETAELAVRAAQTGHLVLSTMHTNDAVSAVTRLWDLGVDSSLITSSLLGVLSQRLVRRLCPDCVEEYAPPAELLHAIFDRAPAGLSWVRGRGCTHCSLTGYSGRVAVAELWTPGDEDAVLVNMRAPFDQIRRSAARSTIPMAADVIDKLVRRQTTVEELVRTLPYSSLRQLREPRP